MKITEAIKEVGRPVQFYPSLARVFGIEESILLGQLLYWKGKESDKEKGIRKSVKEIEEETSLTIKVQKRIKKKLVDLGCIEYKYDRSSHESYYKINEDQINLIFQGYGTVGYRPKGTKVWSQRDLGMVPKVLSSIHRVHIEYSENTCDSQKAFDIFWFKYPVKKSKKPAFSKWSKLDPDLYKKIIEDVDNRKKDKTWLAGFIPNPTTYLNQERWEDEITPVTSNMKEGDKPKQEKYKDCETIIV